jgi:hypothetical protein
MDESGEVLVPSEAKLALYVALGQALRHFAATWPALWVDRVEVHLPAAAVTYRFAFAQSVVAQDSRGADDANQ